MSCREMFTDNIRKRNLFYLTYKITKISSISWKSSLLYISSHVLSDICYRANIIIAISVMNQRAIYHQQEHISLMCFSEAGTGGHPSSTVLGSASPCAILCSISPQRKYGPWRAICMGRRSVGVLAARPSGPNMQTSGLYKLASSAHIFWVLSCVRIGEAHKN